MAEWPLGSRKSGFTRSSTESLIQRSSTGPSAAVQGAGLTSLHRSSAEVSHDGVLLERDDLLATLDSFLTDAHRGRGRLALVAGRWSLVRLGLEEFAGPGACWPC